MEKFIGDAVVGASACRRHDDDPNGRCERLCASSMPLEGTLPSRREPSGGPLSVSTPARPSYAFRSTPPRGRGFLTGDAVNTAARLQAAAPPRWCGRGRPATHDLTHSHHCLRGVGSPSSSKGKAEPVRESWLAKSPDLTHRQRPPLTARSHHWLAAKWSSLYVKALFDKASAPPPLLSSRSSSASPASASPGWFPPSCLATVRLPRPADDEGRRGPLPALTVRGVSYRALSEIAQGTGRHSRDRRSAPHGLGEAGHHRARRGRRRLDGSIALRALARSPRRRRPSVRRTSPPGCVSSNSSALDRTLRRRAGGPPLGRRRPARLRRASDGRRRRGAAPHGLHDPSGTVRTTSDLRLGKPPDEPPVPGRADARTRIAWSPASSAMPMPLPRRSTTSSSAARATRSLPRSRLTCSLTRSAAPRCRPPCRR